MGESKSTSRTATSVNNYNVILLWGKMIPKDRAGLEAFICCLPLWLLVHFLTTPNTEGEETICPEQGILSLFQL